MGWRTGNSDQRVVSKGLAGRERARDLAWQDGFLEMAGKAREAVRLILAKMFLLRKGDSYG
jgi:hypothetical protein